ncbi:MAG: class I SAM-dependent methyltransferase [Candidatus Bathyarchaeia archaeon]|jgi:cyclopropane fatty-acyl-phospholipid synthase-like methyltransferase
MSSDPRLTAQVLPLVNGTTILDVGCGRGRMGYNIRSDWWFTGAGRKRKQLKSLVGVDVFKPYLLQCKRNGNYDDIIMCDATHLPFKKGAFQNVIAEEIIEHMETSQGNQLLKEMEYASSHLTIVTSPRTFIEQDAVDENEHQKHVSLWSEKQFKKQGYTILGRMVPFKNLLSDISWHHSGFPQVSFCIVAKKVVKEAV